MLALAGLTQEVDPGFCELGLERSTVVVLVGDQQLDRVAVQAFGAVQERGEDLALVGLGSGQRPGDGESVQGADQVQAQAPEVAGVRGAVAVLGPSGQVRSLDGLSGTGALDWG